MLLREKFVPDCGYSNILENLGSNLGSSIYLREEVNTGLGMHILHPSGDPKTQVPAYIRCSL
jgi:hypothetical protein